MKIRNLYKVKSEEAHGGTVLAWNLFTGEDFRSSVLFFNDNMLQPGVTIEPHEHQEMEEVYYVIYGKGRIRVGEEEEEIGEGDAVYIPPKQLHSLTNISDYPLRFICLGAKVRRE
jgi:mannose-6-phosphate isomerase-like protein (cupin superfamily)